MKTLVSPLHPNLRVLKPLVVFKDGLATVSDEDADILLARKVLGIVEADAPQAVVEPKTESHGVNTEGDADTQVHSDPVAAPVKLPGKNATVADWTAFMAEHAIKHDEGATKAEMKSLAEERFTARG